jgi:hypothetical protein
MTSQKDSVRRTLHPLIMAANSLRATLSLQRGWTKEAKKSVI